MSGEGGDAASVRPSTAVFVVVYAVLVAFALLVARRIAPFNVANRYEDFAKVAGVLVAAVSGLMAAIVTIINLDRGATDARKLARLNGELSRGVAKLNGEIGQQLADYKAELDRKMLDDKLNADFRLKRLETAFTQEFEAYKDLVAAANTSYYTLAKLASATWTAADKTTLDAAMGAVGGKIALLATRAHADLWERFWNYANFIAESAGKLAVTTEQPELWRKEQGRLASFIQEFQKAMTEKLVQAK